MAEIKIKQYEGPLLPKIKECYDFLIDRLEVADLKSIQCPNYSKWYHKYQEFKTRPTDIWVVSYPKSGTTWTQEMAWSILYDPEDVRSKDRLVKRFPFFEWDSLLPDDASFLNDYDEGNPCRLGETWKIMNNMDDPRTLKSHFHLELLPKEILPSKAKILYVCRDPKDVCVSYYYHSVKLDGFKGDFSDFFELFIADVVFFSPFWKHILDFWKLREEENILFLRYEELKSNLPANIRKVATFLGQELTDEYVKKLENHLSFPNMSKNSAVNNENLASAPTDRAKAIKFLRKGVVGDWKSHFNNDQIERMKKWTEDNLRGSDFPYYQEY